MDNRGIKLTLVVLLLGFHCQSGFGEKLDRLENLFATLSNKFGNFVSAVENITHMLTRMDEETTLHNLILKSSEYINAKNEVGVGKVWNQIASAHKNLTGILDEIIIDSYGGKRETIPTLIRFINTTEMCSGFETLVDEMDDYGHFYDGGEIFSLGDTILQYCPPPLFKKLPYAVQIVLTKNVSLQNTFNSGYLYRKFNVKDNGLENRIATLKQQNATDFWRFTAADDFAETFTIKNRNAFLVASPSRRLYFSYHASSKFILEMNSKQEIGFGMDLDSNQGRKFYRMYAQKNKIRRGESYDVNLWTINPNDEYYKYIYWRVEEEQ